MTAEKYWSCSRSTIRDKYIKGVDAAWSRRGRREARGTMFLALRRPRPDGMVVSVFERGLSLYGPQRGMLWE